MTHWDDAMIKRFAFWIDSVFGSMLFAALMVGSFIVLLCEILAR